MEKTCVICDNPFEAKRSDAETCSAKCRQKNYRKKLDATKPPSPDEIIEGLEKDIEALIRQNEALKTENAQLAADLATARNQAVEGALKALEKPLKFSNPTKKTKEAQDSKELDRPIEYAPVTEAAYDGAKNSTINEMRREEIAAQIAAIKAEKIPPERDKSSMGRQSWAYDQKRRIEELQKQLNSTGI